MDRVELAAFDPRVDSPAPDTATQQLPPRNQPVLRGGEIRNQPVDPRRSRTRGEFFIPQLNNPLLVGHPADRDSQTRTSGAHIGAIPTRQAPPYPKSSLPREGAVATRRPADLPRQA
jgi:hypothetical protein